eukprot:6455736-Amphidinium_carterae.1
MDVLGDIPSTGVFKPLVRPATLRAEDLRKHGVWMRRSTLSRSPSSDQVMAGELWAETMHEVERGHLRGPFNQHEVEEILGTSDWVPSLRFGVRQKDKLRPVDDMTRSVVNLCVGTHETVVPEGVDTIARN